MYSLVDYRDMLEDRIRVDAYRRALESAIRPGDTVVEIGTGVGYFAVLACRAGARLVHAIEPDDAIRIAAEVARVNGCADRIRFVRDLSSRVSIEPADVMVSDLRGVLPFWGCQVLDVIDARERLLRPGGAQIPERDTLWVALTRGPRALEPSPPSPARQRDVALGPLERAIANNWWKERFTGEHLLSDPATWHTLDYRTVRTPGAQGEAELAATEAGDAEGLCVWFDADLGSGIGFSNAPRCPEIIYGHAFFPITPAVRVEAGDRLSVAIRADLVGNEYVWSWRGRVLSGPAAGREFSHSTFHGTPLVADALRKRGDSFVPTLGREGRAHAWILRHMAEGRPLGAIARAAMAEFPGLFRDEGEALARVADLSSAFSE